MSKQEKSPIGLSPLSDAQLQEARDNLVRCLEAYDQRGEQGLQEELELLKAGFTVESFKSDRGDRTYRINP